jgi:hypothetical protein
VPKQAAKSENDTALVFGKYLDGTERIDNKDNDGHGDHREPEFHKMPPMKIVVLGLSGL